MSFSQRRYLAAFYRRNRTTCAVWAYDQMRDFAHDRWDATWGRLRLVAWYVRHPFWTTYILKLRLKAYLS